MDDNLHLLESKVLEAVGLIKELRAENGRLTARCDELAAQVADLEDSRARLSEELAGARATAGDVEGYEEKRKEVEDRVGGLLQKLAALG
ncbi:MAG: cell division protein ZapB [bacterium]|jgi:predicted nuclease with TOPRIM domain|nr:cell division protein ZapB [bacterium]MBK7188278.1 cell division protein ZapB [bacterium]MBK9775330.1 cell division protein ZapB [bacterium]